MHTARKDHARAASARPSMTRALMEQTGLDDAVMSDLSTHSTKLTVPTPCRYRADPIPVPIFAARPSRIEALEAQRARPMANSLLH